jgi:5-methylcytosine-specific restriction protein A
MTTKEDLRPNQLQLVKDVVAAAGLPTDAWGDRNDNTHENMKWCFGEAGKPNVAMIWWTGLDDSNKTGPVSFIDGTEKWAQEAEDKKQKTAATKARHLHSLIMQSFTKGTAIRVALVEGTGFNTDKEKVKKRVLDDELWYPHHYDPVTRQIVVMRGVPQPDGFDPQVEVDCIMKGLPLPLHGSLPAEPYVDPHIEPAENQAPPSENNAELAEPKTRTTQTTVYARDPEVVRRVKERAADGKCECCEKLGFPTARGGYYLEVHHVIPLNFERYDFEWNALAICPDEHKQAHFGINRGKLRDRMIGILGARYPDRLAQLLELARRMDIDEAGAEDLEADFAT